MFLNSEIKKTEYEQLMQAIKKLNEEKSKAYTDETYRLGLKTRRYLKFLTVDGIKSKLERRKQFGHMKPMPDLPGAVNNRKECDYFSNDRIAVYTCITGGYDDIIEPLFVPNNCDFYAITDFELPQDSKWNRIDANSYPETQELNNVLKNRYFKFFPHKIFKDYKYSIYIDGNIKVCSDLTEHVNRISNLGLSFFRHSKRNCAYVEADTCEQLKKETPERLHELMNFLKSEGFPQNYGLIECNFIVRDHKSKLCAEIMEDWWEMFNRFAKRDQLSLPYVLYKRNIKVDNLVTLGNNVHKEYSIEFVQHNKKKHL